MAKRPWRKRRPMTPRRWRKYVERGAFLKPYLYYFPESGGGLADAPTFVSAIIYRGA